MYSTCIFCHRSLSRNEIVEAFPVGRTLAFDPVKGRLWAICPACRRWNLTPLEERWEALEECERLFRTLRTRVHSPEIGVALHPGGLRLIRVGEPLPVEYAALRYGEAFGQRWRRYAFYTGVGTGIGVAVLSLGVLSGAAAGAIGGQLPGLVRGVERLVRRVTVPLPGGEVVKVNPNKVTLLNPEGGVLFRLRVVHGQGETVLANEDARRAASKVLPVLNRVGARKRVVCSAVEQLEQAGGPEGFLEETWGKARAKPGASLRWVMSRDMKGAIFHSLPGTTRLGLEMALQEEQERRALEGELAILTAAWREAEAIAKISDDLLIPRKIEEKLEALMGDEDPQ
jgi:hypothetical protein